MPFKITSLFQNYSKIGSLERDNSVADVLQNRYNRFVDGIFLRINRILKDTYDPVRVRLLSPNRSTKSRKAKNARILKDRLIKRNKKQVKPKTDMNENESSKNENDGVTEEQEFNKKIEEFQQQLQQQQQQPQKQYDEQHQENQQPKRKQNNIPDKFVTNSATSLDNLPAEFRAPRPKPKKPTTTTKSSKPSKSTKVKTKKGNSNEEKVQKPHGTLHGLASLQRIGNVKVTPERGDSLIKSKFTLGPLTLKVEKSIKRGSVRSIKSATARTNEMLGRINLRVVNGVATLISIKVQQPKQVQVESSDNHDRTREFVWRKTPHLAHLVSEKLKVAAESLLEPAKTKTISVHQQ